MGISVTGRLSKMKVSHEAPVSYSLHLGEQAVDMNALLGKQIQIEHSGAIYCTNCSKKTKKSFNQGYCFRCFQKLAQCDRCIMSPELCHYDQGTCREPEWGETHCMQPHVVYLANSSGLKVGITRGTQVPIRWMDQGAIQALPIIEVQNRYQSGLVEHACKELVADKTNWRKMLKHDVEEIDLVKERDQLLAQLGDRLDQIVKDKDGEISFLDDEDVRQFDYPSLKWPDKVVTHNLDKNPSVSGTLEAIKGQYLILDTGCFNVRKFTSYEVTLTVA